MAVNEEQYRKIRAELEGRATLVAVSKTKPEADIRALYALGQRDFGENYVQEVRDKQAVLPVDIRWHFIGHLQRNKVKDIAPFVHLIHGVDSDRLLKEINKQAAKCGRVIDCLLQVHIAQEETKFGLDEPELKAVVAAVLAEPEAYAHIRLCGLMGMASHSDDAAKVGEEFVALKGLFDGVVAEYTLPAFKYLSMGMSGDYAMAVAAGSNMVRIGSLLFGARDYPQVG